MGQRRENDENVIQRCTTHLVDATAWPTRTPPPKKTLSPFFPFNEKKIRGGEFLENQEKWG